MRLNLEGQPDGTRIDAAEWFMSDDPQDDPVAEPDQEAQLVEARASGRRMLRRLDRSDRTMRKLDRGRRARRKRAPAITAPARRPRAGRTRVRRHVRRTARRTGGDDPPPPGEPEPPPPAPALPGARAC